MTYFDFDRRRILKTLGGMGAVSVTPWLAQLANAAEPIKIGVVLPLTGNAGAYGPDMADAAKRTAAKINKAGGVFGNRPIELLFEDSESTATGAVQATRKLLDVHRPSALTGYWGTPEGLAARPVALQADTVIMVNGAGNAITEGDIRGLVWRFQAKGPLWGEVIARAMLSKGIKQASVLGIQNPFSYSMVEPFEQTMAKGGGQVTNKVIYNPDQPSYRVEVDRIFGPKPEAVFLPALLPDFTAIAKEVYRSGFTSKMYTISVAGDAEGRFLKNVGSQVAEGIEHFQPAPDTKSKAYAKFLDMMEAPKDRLYLFAANMYDELSVVALAMERAKSVVSLDYSKHILSVCNGPGQEVDDVVEGLSLLRDGKDINFFGAGSACDFNGSGDQVNRVFAHYRIQNGRNTLLGIVS